ncbi:FAD/NAD(P)-binding domain-containing protein [Peniophora sp. CONT]|nr:FAD/NAD(P)-binding domain-containing protein [Peniophora sp. CONT]
MIRIVIVGGGAAGATLARELSKSVVPAKHSLTLVTARPFNIPLPAAVRTTAVGSEHLEERVLIPYDNLFINGNGTVVVGRVTSVEATKGQAGGNVVLESGEKVEYDILVLAPGNTWSGPLDFPDTKEAALEHIHEWQEKFAAAKSVVLVGGGAVGIEYAGEVRDFFPDKKATIVHNQKLLLNPFFPDKFRKYIEKDVLAAGAEVLLGDAIDTTQVGEGKGITTRNGKKLDADLIVPAFGGKPATKFLTSLGSDVLTSTGHIRVKTNLELPDYPHVFSAGDAIDWNESKQIVAVLAHVPILVANIKSILDGKAPAKEYKGATPALLVTNGRYRGLLYVGILWGITLGNWVASRIKGRTLMIDKTREGMGAKP